MYKKGLTKSKFKQTMKMFWTERWKYERSVEDWVEQLHPEFTWYAGEKSSMPPTGKKALELLFLAIDKLMLEKKLLKTQGQNLRDMLKSPDKENALVALTIMAELKPRKFKKSIKKEVNENT